MEEKTAWLRRVRELTDRFAAPGDGRFNDCMQFSLADCCFEEQSVTYSFVTQEWERNHRGVLHGGAIAGMFDTALGMTAYIAAEGPVTMTTDLTISFLRAVPFGGNVLVKVFIIKNGRNLIRLRAELTDPAGTVLAVSSGSWIVLRTDANI
jgi:uncharacterized protein (TIGR00369 family)